VFQVQVWLVGGCRQPGSRRLRGDARCCGTLAGPAELLPGVLLTARSLWWWGPGLQLHNGPKPRVQAARAVLQGPTESSVKAAKAEIKRILEDSTERAMRREAGAGGVAAGRYSIV
jgi:hypothetical protein